MTQDFQLTDEAKKALSSAPEARVALINSDRWVPTPSTNRVVKWAEYLLRLGRSQRPQCAQVIGDPGMGKTSILAAIGSAHPVKATDDPLRKQRRVLFAEATGETTGAKAVREAIMKSAWPKAKQFQLTALELDDTLQSQEVRLLLLDEVGEFFSGGPSAHRRALSELKRINNLGVHIVATTVTNMKHAFSVDKQFLTRFVLKLTLQPWSEAQDLRNFLFGYERELPLPKRSHLDGKEWVQPLLEHGEGNMSEMLRLIKLSACWAVERGGSCLLPVDLKSALENPEPPPVCLRVPL